jgi:hypothetical protein
MELICVYFVWYCLISNACVIKRQDNIVFSYKLGLLGTLHFIASR